MAGFWPALDVINMEILLVTRRYPPAPGGVESQVMEIARRLRRRGHQISIYCTNLYKDTPFQPLQDSSYGTAEGIDVRRFRAIPIPFRSAVGTSLAPRLLLGSLSRRTPHLVHYHGINLVTISASLILKRKHKCKHILTTHTDPSLLSDVFTTFLKGFDGLIALTAQERRRMLDLGLSDSKIRIIPNGIDIELFRNLPTRDWFRREFGVSNYMILFAGRIDAFDKGCDVLIEAASLVQQRLGKCTIVFAGPDWGSTRYLQALSKRRGVEAIFTGNLRPKDLGGALVACDVFVSPSRREAFGLSILTAMVCGAPVVATRVGGVPSIVQDEATGLLVSPGNPSELADAICRIIQNPRLSASLVANAKERALDYSIENTVSEHEDFYQYILEN